MTASIVRARRLGTAVATFALVTLASPLGAQPVGSDGFDGAWLVTFAQPDGRSLTARLAVEPDARGGWTAWSREGAAAQMVSRGKAIMGGLLGKLPPRGALLRVEGGRMVRRGDSLLVTGRLVSPFVGNRWLEGALVRGRLAGEMRWDSAGAPAGRFDGSPAMAAVGADASTPPRPLRDYVALAARVRQAFTDSLYDPALVRTSAWREFLDELGVRLARATDDLDAMAAFYALKPRLGISHVELFRNPTWTGLTMDSLLARYGAADPATLVRLTFPAPGVAYLRVDRWNDVGAYVDSAFMRIDSARASTLILDIRANPGGDVSSMFPAAHLIRDSQPVGVFLGRRWFATQRRPPTADTLPHLPRVAERATGSAVIDGVRQHGALVGILPARAPRFDGEVYLLIDGRSGSASEPLAHHLRVTERATLVGERTAGAMLSAPPHSIGDGWMLILPEADYYAADGTRLEGRGVDPHVATTSAEAPYEVARRLQARDPYIGALMLGSFSTATTKWVEAERWYAEAARLAPDSAAPQLGLGAAYQARKAWDEAFAAYERALVLRPDDLGALYQVGRTAALSGQRLDRGAAALRAYLARPYRASLPTHAGGRWRLGQILLAQGDRAGARREWMEALRLDPANADAKKALEELGK